MQLATVFLGKDVSGLPLYANLNPQPPRSDTGSGSDGGAEHEVLLALLPGLFHAIRGSPYLSTTSDLTGLLATGDALRVGR